jgi:DNA-binding XRE family transcriptional regulator
MPLATITRKGKQFVLVPVARYQRLVDQDLPPLPPVARDGSTDAIDFARASIARQLIRDRRAAGLSQAGLAKLAGVRQATVSRIESGKHTPTIRIMKAIDRALRSVGID